MALGNQKFVPAKLGKIVEAQEGSTGKLLSHTTLSKRGTCVVLAISVSAFQSGAVPLDFDTTLELKSKRTLLEYVRRLPIRLTTNRRSNKVDASLSQSTLLGTVTSHERMPHSRIGFGSPACILSSIGSHGGDSLCGTSTPCL